MRCRIYIPAALCVLRWRGVTWVRITVSSVASEITGPPRNGNDSHMSGDGKMGLWAVVAIGVGGMVGGG
ncbi:MAG: hypothetical protein ABI144_01440, partial [Gallionella sp.]